MRVCSDRPAIQRTLSSLVISVILFLNLIVTVVNADYARLVRSLYFHRFYVNCLHISHHALTIVHAVDALYCTVLYCTVGSVAEWSAESRLHLSLVCELLIPGQRPSTFCTEL